MQAFKLRKNSGLHIQIINFKFKEQNADYGNTDHLLKKLYGMAYACAIFSLFKM